MKIVVDFELCQSHGVCVQEAPELFEIRDDGFLYVLDESPDESQREVASAAAAGCPTSAIEIQD